MARKIEKKVVVKGDTSQATREMRRLGMAMRKTEAEQKKLAEQNKKTENSDKRLIQTLNKQRMAYDKGFAAKKRFEATSRSLEKAVSRNLITQDQYNAELAQARHHYEQAGMGANQYNKQIRTSRFHTANLTAQFNDIGVMMASGQSPFILAAQQGTQITQVLQQMGGTGREQVGALAAAFKSMISPTTILTLGIIAGAAALVQWVTAGEEAEEQVDNIAEAMKNLKKQAEEAALAQRQIFSGAESSEEQRIRDDILLSRAKEIQLLDRMNFMNEVNVTGAKRRKLEVEEEVKALQAKRKEQEELLALLENERKKQEALEGSVELLETLWGNVKKRLEEGSEEMQRVKRLQEQISGQSRSMQTLGGRAGLRNIREHKEEMIAVFKNAKKLKEKLGEAAFEALRLSEIDLETGVDAAAEAASRLAARLGVSFERAQALMELGIQTRPQMRPMDLDTRTPEQRRQAGIRPQMRPMDLGVPEVKGGGGRSEADKFKDRFEQLREALLTEEELEKESFDRREKLLKEALEREFINRKQYKEMFEELERQHQEKMTNINVYAHGTALQQTEAFMGSMASALQSGNQKLVKIAQAFGAVEALINAYRAYNQVIADPSLPWFAKIPAAASVLAAGLQTVQAIKNVGGGGGGAGGTGGATGATAAAAQAPSTFVNVTLPEQGPIGVGSVRDLIAQINEAVKDGARLEGIRVT